MLLEILLSLFVIYGIWQALKKPSKYPPGPWGLPLIGSIPSSSKEFQKKVYELRKQYGDVLSWRIGNRLIVIICSLKLMKEAFTGPNFANRPNLKLFTAFEGDNPLGVLVTNGAHWNAIRRFSLRHLRDLGMGKSKMVESVQFEAMELVNQLKKQAGKGAPLPHSLTVAVVNVVWRLVADTRYDLDSNEINQFDSLFKEIQASLSRVTIEDFFPWVRFLLPKFAYKALIRKDLQIKLSNEMKKFLGDIINSHKKTLNKSNSRDYIDDYLIEMDTKSTDQATFMSIEDLTYTISDIFGAGSETTKTTITWAIFYMASFQHVQKRLQKEIDEELPAGTQATFEDKPKLPYLEAFIHETLRYSTLVPNGVPHEANNDATLGGYFIPKGAMIIPMICMIHFDPNYFESPNEFRPERFINSEGKFVTPKEGFLPFMIGKRQCLGESLARMELFIFLSTLIQYLHFAIPPGKELDLNPLDSPLVNMPNSKQDLLISIR